ncbi:MAG: hypothetical protein QOF51_2114 [Chloroflexota bacterium]|jgi:hypothetical protein|nr:hypothetical protein [Chloroflexota bacterium]
MRDWRASRFDRHADEATIVSHAAAMNAIRELRSSREA